MKPFVSIIIPIYNVEKYIDECLNTIVNQTLKNIEIILVNDGSTDDSMVIAEKYINTDKRIRVINKKNGGLSSARNAGLKMSKGEYILFIDSDDFVSDKMAEIMYKNAKSNNLDIVMCGYNRIEPNYSYKVDPPLESNIIYDKKEIKSLINTAHRSKFIWYAWRNLYKREMLIKNSIFFDENIKFGEDSIFNLYAYYFSNKIICIKEYLYNYRFNPDSLTQKKYKNYLEENIIKQCNAKIEFYKKFNLFEECCKDFEKYLLTHTLMEIINNIYNSDSRNKIKDIKRIIRISIMNDAIIKLKTFQILKMSVPIGIKIRLICIKLKLFNVLNYIMLHRG